MDFLQSKSSCVYKTSTGCFVTFFSFNRGKIILIGLLYHYIWLKIVLWRSFFTYSLVFDSWRSNFKFRECRVASLARAVQHIFENGEQNIYLCWVVAVHTHCILELTKGKVLHYLNKLPFRCTSHFGHAFVAANLEWINGGRREWNVQVIW